MGGSPFARYIHCDIYYCLTTVNKGLYGAGKLLLNILFIALSLDCIICEYKVLFIMLYIFYIDFLLLVTRHKILCVTNKGFPETQFFSRRFDII